MIILILLIFLIGLRLVIWYYLKRANRYARCCCCNTKHLLDEDYLEMIPEIGGDYYCYECLQSIYWQIPSAKPNCRCFINCVPEVLARIDRQDFLIPLEYPINPPNHVDCPKRYIQD